MQSRRELLALLGTLPLACRHADAPPTQTVRVGLLTSQTGAMAADEAGVLGALRFAVDEMNARADLHGGVKLDPIEADGASDPRVFASQAAALLDQGAVTLFGCWTSASRKAVLPVLDAKNGFLVYPLQYEGLEQHPRVLYTGSTPNQQILPAVRWAAEKFPGSRFFLVGSDYVFPRVANAVIRDQLAAMGATPLDERYLPLDADADTMAGLAGDIANAIADTISNKERPVVLNTVNGQGGNRALFAALRARGLGAGRCPTISFSISTFTALVNEGVEGHYAMWGYLDDLGDAENVALKQALSASPYGTGALVSDPMIAARAGVHLWARAAHSLDWSHGLDLERFRTALRSQSVPCPGGALHVDAENQHTWRRALLGRVDRSGKLRQEWATDLPIHPQPFPAFRSRAAWDALLVELG